MGCGHGDRRGPRVDPEPPCRPRSKFCAPRPNGRRPARLKMGPPRSPARSPYGRTQRRRLSAIHRSAVRPGAQRAAAVWHGRRADIGLLSHSENTVFRIEDRRAGFKAAMRIHRPNYQTRNAIQTELDWMRALNEAGIGTPQALPALDGTVLQRVTRAGGHALCSAVPLDRRRFSRSGQAGRLAAPPGWLSARMHAQSRLAASRPFRAHGLGPRRHGGPGRALGTVGNARRA